MIFKEKEDDLVVGLELDPCPTILITLEKFKEQCGSRKKIPNVSVLGKHVAFRMIENKFQKKWAKKRCCPYSRFATRLYSSTICNGGGL